MVKNTKKTQSRIQRQKLEQRARLWPDLDEQRLWSYKKSDGWLNVPRSFPLILRIMDMLAPKGKPVSQTYLDLWCRTYEDSFVVVADPRAMAFYSGFTGERAESTWRMTTWGVVRLQAKLVEHVICVFARDQVLSAVCCLECCNCGFVGHLNVERQRFVFGNAHQQQSDCIGHRQSQGLQDFDGFGFHLFVDPRTDDLFRGHRCLLLASVATL